MRHRFYQADPMQSSEVVASMRNVTANYPGKVALSGVTFEIPRNQFVGITGPSGSGKSTALRIMENILQPNDDEIKYSGAVEICGQDIAKIGVKSRDKMYRRYVGIGYQSPEFDPDRSVGANLVRSMQSLEQEIDKPYIAYLACKFGIQDLLRQDSSTLSGGQKARAELLSVLASKPRVAFLDEPTGPLNTEGKIQVLETLHSIVRENDTSIVMVAHDEVAKQYIDRELAFQDGILVSDTVYPASHAA